MASSRRPALLVAILLVAALVVAGLVVLLPTGSRGGARASGSAGAPVEPRFDVSSMLRPSGRMLGVIDDTTPRQYGIVDAFTEQAGRAPDIRGYYESWSDDFDPQGNASLWQHGQLPMLVLVPSSTSLEDIADGRDDAHARQLARQIAAFHGPLALSFADEMNGPWNSWGPGHVTPAVYVAAWKHVHDLFHAMGVTNVIWVWSPHVVDGSTPPLLRPYYPGDAYTDWVGLIGYYGPIDGSAFSTLFAPSLRQLAAFTAKPVLISETGVVQGGQKEARIRDLFRHAAEAGVIGLVWYDERKTWPGGSQLMDWRIDTSVGAEAAFQVESARSGFGHPFGTG